MNWLHDSGLAAWVTCAVVLWYTIEAARTRRQLVLQNKRAVMPFITVEFENDSFFVKNIGNSPALNLSIDTLPVDDFKLAIAFPIAYTLAREEGRQQMPFNTMVDGKPSPQRLTWAKAFFPSITDKEHKLIIRFQTIEGEAYKQTIILRPIRKAERPIEVSAVEPDKTFLERCKQLLSDSSIIP